MVFVIRKKIVVEEHQGNEGDKGEDKGARDNREKYNTNGNGEDRHNSDLSVFRPCALWFEVLSPLIMVSLKHLCDRVLTVVVDRCLEYRNSQQRPLVTTTKTKTSVALTSADNPSPAHAIKSKPKFSIPKPTATLPPHNNVTRIETSASSTQSLSGPLLILGFVVLPVLVILVMYCIWFRNPRILRKAKVDVEIDPTEVPLLRPRDYQGDSLAVVSPHPHEVEVLRVDESTSSVADLALEAVVDGSVLPAPRATSWPCPGDNATLDESLSPLVDVTLALATHIDVDPPSFTLSPEGNQSDSMAEPFDVDVDVALPAAIDPLAPAESLPLPNFEDLKDEFDVNIVQEEDDGVSSVEEVRGAVDACEVVLSATLPCTTGLRVDEEEEGRCDDDLASRIPLPDEDEDHNGEAEDITITLPGPLTLPEERDHKHDVDDYDYEGDILFHTHVWRSVERLGVLPAQQEQSRPRVRLPMGSSPPPLPPLPQGIIARPVFPPGTRLFQPPTGMLVSSSRPPLFIETSTQFSMLTSISGPGPGARQQHVFRPRPRGVTFASSSSIGTQIQQPYYPSSMQMMNTVELFCNAPPIQPIYETIPIRPAPAPAAVPVSIPHPIPGPSTFGLVPPVAVFHFTQPNYNTMLGTAHCTYPFPPEALTLYDSRVSMNIGSSRGIPLGASIHTRTASFACPPTPPRAPLHGRVMDIGSSMLRTERPISRPSASSLNEVQVERMKERERNEEWVQSQEGRRLKGTVDEEWRQE